MSKGRLLPALMLCAVTLSAASPALAAGKWVREGNTRIIDGPVKKTKAVELTKDPFIDWPDPDSYALIAFLPNGSVKKKLSLGKINNLSVSYNVTGGVTAGGSPRISIVVDVNRDGQFDLTNDEVVFVSLGNDPFGPDEAGDFFISGNLLTQEGRFSTASGSVVLGNWEDVLATSVNGRPVSQGGVDAVFTIVDFAGSTDPLVVAVTAMQVNKDKLNPKARIPSTN